MTNLLQLVPKQATEEPESPIEMIDRMRESIEQADHAVLILVKSDGTTWNFETVAARLNIAELNYTLDHVKRQQL
jgi:hypothetical protein